MKFVCSLLTWVTICAVSPSVMAACVSDQAHSRLTGLLGQMEVLAAESGWREAQDAAFAVKYKENVNENGDSEYLEKFKNSLRDKVLEQAEGYVDPYIDGLESGRDEMDQIDGIRDELKRIFSSLKNANDKYDRRAKNLNMRGEAKLISIRYAHLELAETYQEKISELIGRVGCR